MVWLTALTWFPTPMPVTSDEYNHKRSLMVYQLLHETILSDKTRIFALLFRHNALLHLEFHKKSTQRVWLTERTQLPTLIKVNYDNNNNKWSLMLHKLLRDSMKSDKKCTFALLLYHNSPLQLISLVQKYHLILAVCIMSLLERFQSAYPLSTCLC